MVCHAIAAISVVQFFSPGSWYRFCDTRSQMKRRFSVYYRFVYSFSGSFQLSCFFLGENFHSKIIRYVDIMLTMRSAHCIFFYGFKQDQIYPASRGPSIFLDKSGSPGALSI